MILTEPEFLIYMKKSPLRTTQALTKALTQALTQTSIQATTQAIKSALLMAAPSPFHEIRIIIKYLKQGNGFMLNVPTPPHFPSPE
jgi:hypothetical protein